MPSINFARSLFASTQAGIIRALASALDCLAGVIIGVAALPLNILRADFDKARAKLAKINGAANAGASMQAQLAKQLEDAISAAGPQGWLGWTIDFRNMLAYRLSAAVFLRRLLEFHVSIRHS